ARAGRHRPPRAVLNHRKVRRRARRAGHDRRVDQRRVRYDYGRLRAIPAPAWLHRPHASRTGCDEAGLRLFWRAAPTSPGVPGTAIPDRRRRVAAYGHELGRPPVVGRRRDHDDRGRAVPAAWPDTRAAPGRAARRHPHRAPRLFLLLPAGDDGHPQPAADAGAEHFGPPHQSLNATAMHLSGFDYDLPPERIAQHPVEPRDASRLLVLHRDTGEIEHRQFRDLREYLTPGDVLVLNQTRVIPARLHARKTPSGAAAEILLLRQMDERRWLVAVGGKRIRPGTQLAIDRADGANLIATVIEERDENQRVVEFDRPINPYLREIGETPLPPYITEPLDDPERYQTVFARYEGSAAAPTAGLHF